MPNLSDPRYLWERRCDVQIVDVREQHEFAQGAIEGAIRIPLGDLMNGDHSLKPSEAIVVVCRTGDKSELAALMLQVRGFVAYNLAGGMQRWESLVLPVVIPDDPGDIVEVN